MMSRLREVIEKVMFFLAVSRRFISEQPLRTMVSAVPVLAFRVLMVSIICALLLLMLCTRWRAVSAARACSRITVLISLSTIAISESNSEMLFSRPARLSRVPKF